MEKNYMHENFAFKCQMSYRVEIIVAASLNQLTDSPSISHHASSRVNGVTDMQASRQACIALTTCETTVQYGCG
jgi:hypothetical protein